MKLKDMFFKDKCPICDGAIPLKDQCNYFNDFHSYFYECFYINIVRFGIYAFLIKEGIRIGESELIIQFFYNRPDEYNDEINYNYVYSIKNVLSQETIFVDNISEDFEFTNESVSILIKKVLDNLIFI